MKTPKRIKKPQKNMSLDIFKYTLAGIIGFEPMQCQSQSLMPYRLAISQ